MGVWGVKSLVETASASVSIPCRRSDGGLSRLFAPLSILKMKASGPCQVPHHPGSTERCDGGLPSSRAIIPSSFEGLRCRGSGQAEAQWLVNLPASWYGGTEMPSGK